MKKSTFWSFNLGHVLTLAVYLVTGAIFVGKQQQIIANQEKKIDALIQRVDQIDREGTQFSRVDASKFLNLDTRVTRLEEFIPKIAVISTEISNISKSIEEMKVDIRQLRK